MASGRCPVLLVKSILYNGNIKWDLPRLSTLTKVATLGRVLQSTSAPKQMRWTEYERFSDDRNGIRIFRLCTTAGHCSDEDLCPSSTRNLVTRHLGIQLSLRPSQRLVAYIHLAERRRGTTHPIRHWSMINQWSPKNRTEGRNEKGLVLGLLESQARLIYRP